MLFAHAKLYIYRWHEYEEKIIDYISFGYDEIADISKNAPENEIVLSLKARPEKKENPSVDKVYFMKLFNSKDRDRKIDLYFKKKAQANAFYTFFRDIMFCLKEK